MLGMAEEFKGKVAINALWPRTGIATAAVKMLAGSAGVSACRTPEIMADSAHWILSQVPHAYCVCVCVRACVCVCVSVSSTLPFTPSLSFHPLLSLQPAREHVR